MRAKIDNYFLECQITILGNRTGLVGSDFDAKYFHNQWKMADSLYDLLTYIDSDIDVSDYKNRVLKIRSEFLTAANHLLELESHV